MDLISTKFDTVITLIDGERFSGYEGTSGVSTTSANVAAGATRRGIYKARALQGKIERGSEQLNFDNTC